MEHDIVIRGGNIVDGTGSEPVTGDVCVSDGIITQVGGKAGTGSKEIDADGLVVTPGFIDLHTHLDAQVMFEPVLTSSCWHGVTTALMGNCGVTFAPCKPADRLAMAEMMESVEDIPRETTMKGLPWSWETYGEYLDTIERSSPGINLAGLVGHCAVRWYVMGERAVEEQSTGDERRQMADIVGKAIDAGAIGFSTNRLPGHKMPDGRSIPGTFADANEIETIANAVRSRNGLMQVVPTADRVNVELLQSIGQWGNRLLFSWATGPQPGDAERSLKLVQKITDGVNSMGICQARPTGAMFSLQSYLPGRGPSWDALAKKDLAGRLATLEDQDAFNMLVSEATAAGHGVMPYAGSAPASMEKVFYLGNDESPHYEPSNERHLLSMAERAGEHWSATFLRLSRQDRGRSCFGLNFIVENINELEKLLAHERVLPSLGDAGAHVAQMIDAGWPTFVLNHWVGQKGLYSLGNAVRRMTSTPAAILGLNNRGALKVGMKADINVIDLDNLAELQPEIVHDLPGGAPRYIQKSRGYKATIVNGQLAIQDSELVGGRHGTVLRSAED